MISVRGNPKKHHLSNLACPQTTTSTGHLVKPGPDLASQTLSEPVYTPDSHLTPQGLSPVQASLQLYLPSQLTLRLLGLPQPHSQTRSWPQGPSQWSLQPTGPFSIPLAAHTPHQPLLLGLWAFSPNRCSFPVSFICFVDCPWIFVFAFGGSFNTRD